MNIVLKTYGGAIVVRPDTTWERDNEDLYLPDFVTRVSAVPVACARVCKPGRSVGARFAERYIDRFGYGVLLYPEDFIDGSAEGFAAASCLDHTSFIQMPDAEKLPEEFRMTDTTYRASEEALLQAVADVTKRIYIRIGDIIAVELAPRERIFDRSDGNVRITGEADGKMSADFNIIVE